MNIFHRIVFNARQHQSETKALDQLDICYRYNALPAPESLSDPVGLITFEMDESDPRWKSVEDLCSNWDCLDHVYTRFSPQECKQASFPALDSCWLNGYPMPDDDAGYLASTYSEKRRCRKCGVGLEQASPFRIKGEPK